MQIEISTASGIEIKKLMGRIPEFDTTTSEEIENRISGKCVELFSSIENSVISGFILAFEINPQIYYNRINRVLPDYRGKCMATIFLKPLKITL